jgi:hypothetical protein
MGVQGDGLITVNAPSVGGYFSSDGVPVDATVAQQRSRQHAAERPRRDDRIPAAQR